MVVCFWIHCMPCTLTKKMKPSVAPWSERKVNKYWWNFIINFMRYLNKNILFIWYLVCLTNGGADPHVPCVFPFIINNITFTECIVDQYGSWCSTAVDSEGVHVSGQGKWGECGPGCPIPPPGNKWNDDFSIIHCFFRFTMIRIFILILCNFIFRNPLRKVYLLLYGRLTERSTRISRCIRTHKCSQ